MTLAPLASAGVGTLGIVGLGLVGGSLAHAIRGRSADAIRVLGVDPRDDVRDAALAGGLVDEARPAPDEALASCDVVVLCAPIAAIEALLGPTSRAMRDGAILTDVGGVKLAIRDAARVAVRRGVPFVGAHPMFGGERGGLEAARPDLWRSGVVAVCEDDAERWAIDRVVALHEALGARVVRCTAEAHDAAVAWVSHLPYVTSAARDGLAREAAPLALELAGRGFADATRLAGFAFEIQGEVARRNPHLPGAVDALIDRLRAIRDALSAGAEDARQAIERGRRS